ncbi:hypothetical protein CDL15_Pgr012031 [Punica granatum]|uniref:Prolamin-like domain-containing protein n=1 Tax=Punica granatum TaxID=22663 RepID=A0A218VV80_PUNGR|nr:hypothetical protein CDL15_Pgr012031 [Punica granatum]PKI33422.1 hypothetical protein CRG98_046185 [Punica granatum]
MVTAMVKLVLFAILLASLSCQSVVGARTTPEGSKSDLVARLRLDDQQSPSCWESMFQLQSCTGEVIMFFLNGETYLGPKCCDAIRTIEHDCWPNLLGTLGYTTEEGDILEGYCDEAVHNSTLLSPESNKLKDLHEAESSP